MNSLKESINNFPTAVDAAAFDAAEWPLLLPGFLPPLLPLPLLKAEAEAEEAEENKDMFHTFSNPCVLRCSS